VLARPPLRWLSKHAYPPSSEANSYPTEYLMQIFSMNTNCEAWPIDPLVFRAHKPNHNPNHNRNHNPNHNPNHQTNHKPFTQGSSTQLLLTLSEPCAPPPFPHPKEFPIIQKRTVLHCHQSSFFPSVTCVYRVYIV